MTFWRKWSNLTYSFSNGLFNHQLEQFSSLFNCPTICLYHLLRDSTIPDEKLIASNAPIISWQHVYWMCSPIPDFQNIIFSKYILYVPMDFQLHNNPLEKMYPPSTSIAPENGWSEDYFPSGMAYFQWRTVSFREGDDYKRRWTPNMNSSGTFTTTFYWRSSILQGHLGSKLTSGVLRVVCWKAQRFYKGRPKTVISVGWINSTAILEWRKTQLTIFFCAIYRGWKSIYY